MDPHATSPVEVFCSYAHEDEALCKELAAHLRALEDAGKIKLWHDRRILPGEEWAGTVDERLDAAHVILLLVSHHFFNSEFCRNVELPRALERHHAGSARAVPVILSPYDWHGTPLGKLNALPTDGRPVTEWPSNAAGFLDVAKGIRALVGDLLGDAGPWAAGARPSPPAPPSVPRPPVVDFVTRKDEKGRDLVEVLKEELAPSKQRLIALYGAAGVGKTALAVETARAWSETSGSRVVWASADGRKDFTLDTLLDEIATQLGGAHGPSGNLGDTPAQATAREKQVRSLIAAAPTLIVLDNFETIEVSEARRCGAFLADVAPCPALITTRLQVRQARPYVIPNMSPDEAHEFLRRLIAQNDGSSLAIDRDRVIAAASANPFLMDLLIGHILSDPHQEPHVVLRKLARRRGGDVTRIFDRSYNHPLMDKNSRIVLLALALFVPGASRHALAEVVRPKCKEAQFERALELLRSLRLVRAEPGHRLVIEPTTREFARVRLDKFKGGSALLRQSFVGYYRAYALAHVEFKPEDFDALAVEKDNLLYAVDLALKLKDWKSVMEITDAIAPLDGFLDTRGYWDEAIKRNKQARDAAREEGRGFMRAVFSIRVGIIRQRLGHYEDARAANQQALKIFQEQAANERAPAEDRKLARISVARTYHNLADVEQHMGNRQEAVRLFKLSLEMMRELDDQYGIAFSLQELAAIAYRRGDFDEAESLCQEILEIGRKLSAPESVVADTLQQLGIIACAKSDFALASRHYEESLRLRRRLGDRRAAARVLNNLAIVATHEGDLALALERYSESLRLARELNVPHGVASALLGLGGVALRRGELGEARRALEEGHEIAQDLDDLHLTACLQHQLARVTMLEGDARSAARLLNTALASFKRLKSPKAKTARRSLWRCRWLGLVFMFGRLARRRPRRRR